MKKQIWIPILIIAVIIVGLIIFVPKSKNSAEKETIKIGAILPLSGEIANWGSAAKDGVELAIQEINKVDGVNNKNIEIIYEDDQCDKVKAATAAQKLINIDKVKVIIGPLCSGSVLAVAPIAKDAKVIILGFGSTAAISNAGDYIFRHTYSDAYQGTFLAEQIYNNFSFSKVNVIYVNNDYGVGLFNGFKDAFVKLGGSITNEQSYSPDVTDFNTILTKIKNVASDALVIISYGKEGGTIVKRARELGIELQVFATDNFGTEDVITTGASSAENVIFTSSAPLDERSPNIKEFKNNFLALYGKEPTMLLVSASGYDAANIVIKAIRESSYNSEAIKNNFYALKNYQGLSGDISFDENGDATKEFTLQIIKNGQFVPLEN